MRSSSNGRGFGGSWASNCVSAILAAKRMSLSGWTQAEIGDFVGLKQNTVSENIGKLNEFKLTIISDFYDKGKLGDEGFCQFYQI